MEEKLILLVSYSTIFPFSLKSFYFYMSKKKCARTPFADNPAGRKWYIKNRKKNVWVKLLIDRFAGMNRSLFNDYYLGCAPVLLISNIIDEWKTVGGIYYRPSTDIMLCISHAVFYNYIQVGGDRMGAYLMHGSIMTAKNTLTTTALFEFNKSKNTLL